MSACLLNAPTPTLNKRPRIFVFMETIVPVVLDLHFEKAPFTRAPVKATTLVLWMTKTYHTWIGLSVDYFKRVIVGSSILKIIPTTDETDAKLIYVGCCLVTAFDPLPTVVSSDTDPKSSE